MAETRPEKTYSERDMRAVVARELAKEQIAQLQVGAIAVHKHMLEMQSLIQTQLKDITKMLTDQPAKIDKCKEDLRKEIEKDFPDRLELMRMETRIEASVAEVRNEVKTQWVKITVTIAVISAVIAGIGIAMNYYLLVSRITGH